MIGITRDFKVAINYNNPLGGKGEHYWNEWKDKNSQKQIKAIKKDLGGNFRTEKYKNLN